MRLFAALAIPAEARRQVRERVERIRPRLPKARWVPEENLHLTLAFLGDVEALQLDALDRCLAELCAPGDRLAAVIGGGGTFPLRRPARVVWLDVELQPDAGPLQARIVRRASRLLGRPLDSRPFRPHLTVARCRTPWARPACQIWAEASSAAGPDFAIDRVTLFESHLRQSGARYSTVAEYPLANGSAAGAAGE